MPCTARLAWGPSGLETCRLRDLNSRGAFVYTRTAPIVGLVCDLELVEGSATVASGQARVVWEKPGEGVAVEFLDVTLDEATWKRLMSAPQAAAPKAAKVQTSTAQPEQQVSIGIDLGTTNTCASAVINGKPQVLQTRYGTNTIPSIVAFDAGGKALVGTAAAKRMELNPETTVYGSKRLIGRAYRESVADEFQPHFAYPIVEAPGRRFGARVGETIVSMDDIAVHLLSEMRDVAAQQIGTNPVRAVITVPAYFGEVQRDAVRCAAVDAGFKDVRLVNEPTAAALAYGFNRQENVRIAVFDLGGGTFDISVLRLQGNHFEVLGTDGDLFLGGLDFDELIAQRFLADFCAEHDASFAPDAQQWARLRKAAEECKQGLSAQKRYSVTLPHFARVDSEPRTLNGTMDRADFELLAAPLIERMMQATRATLERAKIEPRELDDVILVGGSTRMPMVQQAVENYFGKKPSQRVHLDEAVAIGAALLAADTKGKDAVTLVDVLPLSIGVSSQGRKFLRLIQRNTSVPVERSFTVATEFEDQAEFELPLFQGERADAIKNEYLGTVVIEDIPPGAAGSHQYELLLALDNECILSIKARDMRTGAACQVKLDRGRDLKQMLKMLGPYDDGGAGATTKAAEPEKKRSVVTRFFSAIARLFGR